LKALLIAIVFGFSGLASLPENADVDDATQISKAIDTYYFTYVYSRIAWTNVRISVVRPYAIFEAENGETAVQTLLQDIDGTWNVTLPGKGVIEPDLLASVGVPVDTANRLLAMCPLSRATRSPSLPIRQRSGHAIFGATHSYRTQIGGRLIQSTVRSMSLPAETVLLLPASRFRANRRIAVSPASGVFCS
jgi:hypothetical protein